MEEFPRLLECKDMAGKVAQIAAGKGINTPYQPALSTHPITHPINPTCQHTPSTHPINLLFQNTLLHTFQIHTHRNPDLTLLPHFP